MQPFDEMSLSGVSKCHIHSAWILKRQVKRVMGTRPAAHRFADSPDDRQLVGVSTRREGSKRWSWSKARLEAPSLTASPHLPPANDERESRRSSLRQRETGFRKNVSGLAGGTSRT